MAQVSCRSCRRWFDKKLGACPACGWERPGQNKWLVTAELNAHLYQTASETEPKAVYERTYRAYKRDLDTIAREL